MAADHSTRHIIQSLLVNVAIATVKGVAAALTGSGAMLAEAIHSSADCGNQGLLLLGVKRSRKPADARHPLGHGRALYFWSFMVALLLFTGGGVFSIYEGLHKIAHPEPVERVWLAFVILGFALALEGYAAVSNVREINRRRAGQPFVRYLRETKDSDLVVVFGENGAATLGLAVAIVALALAAATGDSRLDGVGCVLIGGVLVAVAVFLAVEVKSLILGENADPAIESEARALVAIHPGIAAVTRIITIQQGPGEVVAAVKIQVVPQISASDVCKAISDFETALRKRCPEVRWCFVEPWVSPEISANVP